mmetsp:Transcript_3250/g.8153  ORF Transcript_3250/g.8153 Transcript_3250/m.8153 type:complete len:224 (+) Transcript_3250:3807-4478(+)
MIALVLQLCLHVGQRGLCLGQGVTLGCNNLDDLGVRLHGAHPQAHAAGSIGVFRYLLRGELRIVHHAAQPSHHRVRDVVPGKLHQAPHKLRVAEHLLGTVPVCLLLQQDADALHRELHQVGGLRERLDLGDVILVQRAEALHGGVQRRQRRLQLQLLLLRAVPQRLRLQLQLVQPRRRPRHHLGVLLLLLGRKLVLDGLHAAVARLLRRQLRLARRARLRHLL